MRWAAMLLVAGCGRIAFDPTGSSGDANDARPRDAIGRDHYMGPRAWVKRNDPAPGKLFAPRLAFDTYRNHVVLYGGDLGFPAPSAMITDAMWEFTPSGWTPICQPCGLGSRLLAGFAYD